MSVKLNTASIEYNDYMELEKSVDRIFKRLELFKSVHHEFSYVIEKNEHSNTITVKSCILSEESAN